MVTRAKKRPILSCHPYVSFRACYTLHRQREHCVIEGRHVNMTTGNCTRHICATYRTCIHGWSALD